MLGNEALARGLYEAGVKFASSYPGTPSTEVTEAAAKYPEIYAEWAPNEKVAMESAFGASLAGNRSFCGMKHVGLNVAADPLYTMSYTGINAGLVICVADDPGMHSSQNEQDSRHHAIAAKVPMLEPSDSQETLEFTKLAYEISEKFDTPVIIKMCTRVAHSQSKVTQSTRQEPADKSYTKNPQKYVMVPANAKLRHPIVEKRTINLTNWAETTPINRIDPGTDTSMGIITSSTSYMYVKEVCGSKHPVLKLGMTNPLPVDKIRQFAKTVSKLIVVEELDGIIENHCKAIGCPCIGNEIFPKTGELSQRKIARSLGLPILQGRIFPEEVPFRPPVLCSACPHRSVFYLLKRMHLNVIGDIGCYTLGAVPPLAAMDTTLCMGASISGAHGFNKLSQEMPENGQNKQEAQNAQQTQNAQKTVAVIGDSTFMHSGITGLVNVAYNQSNTTTIIMDNSITGMTGHQQNPTTGKNLKGDPAGKVNLEALCKSIGIKDVQVVDPYDLKSTQAAIKQALQTPEASVIISRRPCALLKEVKHPGPIQCDPDACIGCKACMTIGCPAISMAGGKAQIDQNMCLGCGVCAQLCRKGALPTREDIGALSTNKEAQK